MSDKKKEANYTSCQAETADGDSCKHPAIYPKDNPIACHIEAHQKQLGVYEDVPEEVKKADEEAKQEDNEEEVEGEVKETPENPFDNTKKHVFSTDRLTHTVFVQYPEEDDRDYFRAVFEGGRWETNNDEKAKLLKKKVDNRPALNRVIDKIQ